MWKILSLKTQITVDVKGGWEIGCTGCVFGDARVLAHVARVHRLDGQTADFSANFTDGDLVTGLDLSAVKKPKQGDGRVALDHGALQGGQLACVWNLVPKGEGNYLGQNWKKRMHTQEFQTQKWLK